MQYILLRGVLLTLRRRGVSWRGTLYPLDELKRAHAGLLASPAGPYSASPAPASSKGRDRQSA